MDSIELKVGGMTCDHCIRAVSQALSRQPGTRVEQVTIGTALVSYDPSVVTTQRLVNAIEDEGYQVVSQEVRS
jgi:copper chaperone